SAPPIVSDSALKNAPVTPPRKASGKKMMIVAADEPDSGWKNSRAASITLPLWFSGASRNLRTMCSIMTTASSMMSPTAAAMPPSVMMLKPIPKTISSVMVVASTVGTTTIAISVILVLRRNTNSTIAASTMPIRIVTHALRRLGDEHALVVPGRELHARRQDVLRVREDLLDVVGDLHAVAVGLLVDVHQH